MRMTKSLSLDELSEVEAWRFEQLVHLGFAEPTARRLLHIPDVAHKAADLLDRDLPHDVAFWKLRDDEVN